jgi:hypothetical protein
MQTLSHPYLLPVARLSTDDPPSDIASPLIRLFQHFELADLRHQIATVSTITSVISSMAEVGSNTGRRFERPPSSLLRCGPLFTKHARHPSHLEDILSSPTTRRFLLTRSVTNPDDPKKQDQAKPADPDENHHTHEAHAGMSGVALSLLLSWKISVRSLAHLRSTPSLTAALADPGAHALRRLVLLLALEAADDGSADPALNQTWRNLSASESPLRPLLAMAWHLRRHVQDTILAPGMSIVWKTATKAGLEAVEDHIKALLFMPLIPPAHAGGSTARMPSAEAAAAKPDFDIKPFYFYGHSDMATRVAPGIVAGDRKPLSAVTLAGISANAILKDNLGVFDPIPTLTLDCIPSRSPWTKMLSIETQIYQRAHADLWSTVAVPQWFETGLRERRANDPRFKQKYIERTMRWGLHPIPARAGRNIPALPVEDRLAGRSWMAEQTHIGQDDVLCVAGAPIKQHNHVAIDAADRDSAYTALNSAAALTWSFTSLVVLASAEASMRDPVLQLRLDKTIGVTAVVTTFGELDSTAAGETDSAALLAWPGQGHRLTRLVEEMDHHMGSSFYTALADDDVDLAAESEGLSLAGLGAGNRNYALGAAWEVILTQSEAMVIAMDTELLTLPTEERMTDYVRRVRGITPAPTYSKDDSAGLAAFEARVEMFSLFSHTVPPGAVGRMAPKTLYGVERPAETCVPRNMPFKLASRLAAWALETIEDGATAITRTTLSTMVHQSRGNPRHFLSRGDDITPAVRRTALLQALKDLCFVDENGETIFSVLAKKDEAYFGPVRYDGKAKAIKRPGIGTPGPPTIRRPVRPHEMDLLERLHRHSVLFSKGEITIEQVFEWMHPWPKNTLGLLGILLRMVVNASPENMQALNAFMPWAPSTDDIAQALNPTEETRVMRHVVCDTFGWKRRI